MKKTTSEIIAQIRSLLNELEGIPTESTQHQKSVAAKTAPKKVSGCIGTIQELIEEGFFETQKTVSQVLEKLKEEGQPYSKPLVSMNLLNLVKPPRKTLRRIKENDQWQYIVRK